MIFTCRICLLACCVFLPACTRTTAGTSVRPSEKEFPSRAILDRDTVVKRTSGVTSERYPNADDVLVEEHVLVRYGPDGTAVYRDDEYIKILTEKGKRNHRTFSLCFNKHYSKVSADLVEIIKPDGTVVEIDVKKQGRVMVDRSQMSSNIYNPDQKVLKISVPGIEPGDICHRRVTYRNIKARMPNTWSDYNIWEGTSPMLHIVYEIEAPKELPLVNMKLKHPVKDTVSYRVEDIDYGKRHCWEVKDVPRMYKEPDMPPLHTVVQHQIVSTIKSWEDVSRWYWNLCKPRLEATTPEMKTRVEELVRGSESDMEKVRRIFTFVSQEIRYMGITTEKTAPGYEPHDVSITFKNRYGVCRDKAALLAAMLRLAGLKGYPVLIHAGPKKDRDVPQPYFNHAITAVELKKGEFILMDPTDENTARLLPEYLCDMSYVVAHPAGRTLQTSPIIPAEENLLKIRNNGSVDVDGRLRVEASLRFEGVNDTIYRGYFARQKEEKRRRFFESRIKSTVPGAELVSFSLLPENLQDTDKPLTAKLVFTAKDYPLPGRGIVVLRPPLISGVLGSANFLLRGTGLDKRKYPLDTQFTCGVRETFELDISNAGLKISSLPDKYELEEEGISFARKFETAKEGLITGRSEFLLTNVEFSPEEYLGLKKLLRDMEYQHRKRLLFKPVPDYSLKPDIKIISHETNVDIEDFQHWKTVVAAKKKVLTYAGKKANSEIRIDYNPAWEKITVDEARVTGRNGVVKNISSEEMNLMDAGWVGSAPRYPAEKTLVLSLPGVEVGSIIETRISIESSGKPFLSIISGFGGFAPVSRKKLVLSTPAEMNLEILEFGAPGHPGPVAEKKIKNGRVIRTWSASELPALREESDMPPVWSMVPAVLASSGRIKSYAVKVSGVLEGAVETGDEIRKLARKAIGDASGPEEKIRNLRDFVAVNLRPAGPSFSRLPLSAVTPASRTLKEGYGNSADRAVVLYSLFKSTGMKPEFILAWGSDPRVTMLRKPVLKCLQREMFDTVLVRVKSGKEYVYLNDGSQYAALGATGFDGHLGLNTDGDILEIKAMNSRKDRLLTEYLVEIDKSGDALVTRTRKFHGTWFEKFHRMYAEMPPEKRKMHHRRMLTGISQAAEPAGELVTRFTSCPGSESFTAEVRRFAVRDGDRLYCTVPRVLSGILPAGSDKRSNPLMYATGLCREVVCRIKLPAGTKTASMIPDDFAWRGPAGLGEMESNTRLTEGKASGKMIIIRRKALLKPAVIPAEKYADLLEVDRRLKGEMWSGLLFEISK